jgi:arylsulfatase A-like enzyme
MPQWRDGELDGDEVPERKVRTRDWKYVHDPMGDCDELYDLRADPWELTNLGVRSEQRDVIADLRLRLADWSIETEDGRPVPLP